MLLASARPHGWLGARLSPPALIPRPARERLVSKCKSLTCALVRGSRPRVLEPVARTAPVLLVPRPLAGTRTARLEAQPHSLGSIALRTRTQVSVQSRSVQEG
eukprot:365470-Chlamydomonas_euryale.AAC.4